MPVQASPGQDIFDHQFLQISVNLEREDVLEATLHHALDPSPEWIEKLPHTIRRGKNAKPNLHRRQLHQFNVQGPIGAMTVSVPFEA